MRAMHEKGTGGRMRRGTAVKGGAHGGRCGP